MRDMRASSGPTLTLLMMFLARFNRLGNFLLLGPSEGPEASMMKVMSSLQSENRYRHSDCNPKTMDNCTP